MTPERWADVKRIFQAALDLPAPDRPAFVLSQTTGDDDLRREVESLLAAEAGSGDFLADSAPAYVPGALDDLDDAPDANLGRVVGAYRIEREIGAGGMGAVYLAERTGEFRQQVALKLMRRGMDSRAVVQRFRYERQILAGLDHPNIARLLDGGATDDGRPYFVMEFVEGVPIDEYCAAHALSIPERLRLFLHVCAAVQYAHQNLIVHRDLKPGNILVTAAGEPKLLDFGIAKLLRQEIVEETAGLTQLGLRLMTPEYASPEQVRGLPVAAASDIYSLGVILYELLTGKPPYQFPTRSPVEVERVVSTVEPQRPSVLAGRLKGDLDVIVLKALEKDPARRYASVEQFAGDIRRHLDGLPIVARPQTLAYRAGRFVRRHRVPVVATAFVILTLAVSLVIALRERARAERNFADLRHLTQSFLFDFRDRIKDLPGSTDARNAVLQTALDYLRRLGAEARGDDAVARDVAEAWLRLGDVQGNPYGQNRGDTAAALASYREALALSENLVRRNPADAVARLYLSRAHMAVADLLPQQGDAAAAVPHLRAAIDALAGATDRPGREQLARSWESLGDVLGHPGIVNLNDPAGARDAYSKALAIDEFLGAPRPIAILHMKLGDLAGDPSESLAQYRASAAVFKDPREIGMIHRKIGGALESQGKTREALAEYQQATSIAQHMMAADSNNNQARMDYVVALKTRADLLQKERAYAEALPLYREIVAILGPMSAARPDNVLLRSRHAQMILNVGGLLAKLGRLDEARLLYAEGLGVLKELADRPNATPDDRDTYAEYAKDNPFAKR